MLLESGDQVIVGRRSWLEINIIPVARLGLARPAEILWRVGDRSFLRARADAPPPGIACAVDVDDRKVEVPGLTAGQWTVEVSGHGGTKDEVKVTVQ